MAVQVPLETVGGLVACCRPEDMPDGASPRNFDVDYMIGRWYQRPGLQSRYSYENSAVGPKSPDSAVNTAITGNAWGNPGNVVTGGGAYAISTPGAGTDGLDVTEFAFDQPPTAGTSGIAVAIGCWATSSVQLTAQLLLNGQPVGTAKTVTMPASLSTLTLGGAADAWDTNGLDVNATTFGVRLTATSAFPGAQALVGSVAVTLTQIEAPANINYLKTLVSNDGSVTNLFIDANGAWWIEDVTNDPGVLQLVMDGLAAGSYASSVTAEDGEFICFTDLTTGSDLPRKFTVNPQTMDRVSQVGPGAAPVFAASNTGTSTYPIESITQPAAQSRGSSYFLQSTGPGSTTPGTVVTVYYSDSTGAGPDNDLVTAFNSGNAVYVYTSFTGGPVEQGPYTVQVTSVGEGSPPGQPRQFYYFTYVLPTSAYTFYAGSGHPGYTANYQRTLATVTTTEPVPQLTVGSQITVSGATPSSWDTSWNVTQLLNSGAMVITQSSLLGGIATFSYSLTEGTPPAAGQLVTITGTLNANGTLNGQNLTIASASGGATSGTFTVSGYSAVTNYPAEAEQGQATTAGTEFTFDPGLGTLGTSTSPIYGNTTVGGTLTFTGSQQYIGAGTRQGVVFFITRNGFQTCPSPPVTFSITENVSAIQVSQIPIGPPNVVARGIAFTQAGANGIPGGNFFTIPNPVQYIVNNVTYTASSLIINDNVTTSATFSFPDATLLAAEAIDVQGNNLFDLVELGNPAWVRSYASRNVYGLVQNKLQNFLNLSFDGGYLPGAQLTPLGWTVPDTYGSLLVSPVFGNSYYIRNTSGGTLATAGLISQSAYQDSYLVPILLPNTTYSVRVTARIPSGNTTGNLVVDLTASGVSYGSYTLPFSGMTETMQTFTGTLLTTTVPTVPAALLLRLYAQQIAANADVEVDRIEIFPTEAPVDWTTVWTSYASNPESVDINTGDLDTSENNAQACLGAAVVLDQLILLKTHSMYTTQDSANYEPDDWDVHEMSEKVGICGINAYDYGDEWLLMMEQSGVYGYNGGRPEPISRELQLFNGPTPDQPMGLWESIHWAAAKTFWLRNDLDNRRFYCGVALPTPNFWLPDAPVNAAPTQPNVILMCNYEGCPTFDELVSSPPVHTTIMGMLKALEQRRKWSIWQIPCPYMGQLQLTTGPQLTQMLGNGIASGKIYELVPQKTTDDGVGFQPLYTTYGFVTASQGQQLQLGAERKLLSYWSGNVAGSGTAALTVYPNTLKANAPKTNPYPLQLQAEPQNDDERRFELGAQRFFLELKGAANGYMECGRQTVDLAPHPWNTKRGITL